MRSTQYFRKTTLGLMTCLLFAGCVPKSETEKLDEINAPKMTMDLPITLSSVLATGNTSSTTSQKSNSTGNHALSNADTANDPGACEQYFDPEANFMENGYSMTRFLVGLSQQQSCFADFIMGSVVTMGKSWINQGIQNLPVDENDHGAPSHAQIEQSGDMVQVWLYFATHGEALPADKSTTNTLYLTWTGTGDDISGQFFMTNMPVNPEDPDAPEGVRVDFTRTTSTADNKIYLKMRDSHSGGMGGFRIDVSQVGVDANATYTAKGLITFNDQPFPNMPAGLDSPNFTASAVVNADGLGASIANFNNFGISLAMDNNGNGVIDTTAPDYEMDLGTYQFTIADKTYFDPALNDELDTTTPFVEQVIEWKNKAAANAVYVADHQRIIANPSAPNSIINCLEGDTLCDFNGNGVLDADQGELIGWGLGTNYFADVCIDDATVTNDCNAFVDGLFAQGGFGNEIANSTDAEPTGDWRNEALINIVQLDTVHPTSDTTGETTFDVPDAPTR